jgi:hypothetical protein
MAVGLNREDISLLMESYKNQMESYAALSENHIKILANEEVLIRAQGEILNKQSSMIGVLSGHIENCTTCKNDHRIDTVKIVGQIKWAWVGMTSIIIGLIGLGYKLVESLNQIGKLCGGIKP